MTLAEMAAGAARIAGRLTCPNCGCTDFRTYKTQQGHVQTFRYKACRHCGHKLFTTQEPERAIRDVGPVPEGDGVEELDGDIV